MTGKKKVFKIALIIVFVLAVVLRFVGLSRNPPGFFCDEAAIGYNAYLLLKTGQDEYGQSWPVFFRSFGEYKNPVLIYSSILPIAIFGLNEFSVRLTAAVYGFLGVVAIYFLGEKVGGKKVGFFSALFLAISPWHLHFSRVALEGLMPFVFFIILGSYFWLNYREKSKTKDFLLAIFFFALALYSYFPARIFIPLFCGSLVFVSRKRLWQNKKQLIAGSIFVLFLISPLFFHVFFGSGLSRWWQVREEARTFVQYIKLYCDHFSADFLFFLGDADFPGQFIKRHSVIGKGELYSFQAPLLCLGLWGLLKKKRSVQVLIGFWFLFYPVGTIFTQAPGPQATRSIIGLIPFQLVSALGAVVFFNWLETKIGKGIVFSGVVGVICLLMSFSFFDYLVKLKNYPAFSADYWGWQYGPRLVMEYFREKSPFYDQLVMTDSFNAPQIFLRFYDLKDKCFNCRVGNLVDFDSQRRQLFAIRVEEEEVWRKAGISYQVKKRISYPSGQPAFLFIEPFEK